MYDIVHCDALFACVFYGRTGAPHCGLRLKNAGEMNEIMRTAAIEVATWQPASSACSDVPGLWVGYRADRHPAARCLRMRGANPSNPIPSSASTRSLIQAR